MKNHTKIYIQYFGDGWLPCEVCGRTAVDVHHIEARGMGGGRGKDEIDNLMGLCRECHIEYGDKKQWKQFLKEIHERKVQYTAERRAKGR